MPPAKLSLADFLMASLALIGQQPNLAVIKINSLSHPTPLEPTTKQKDILRKRAAAKRKKLKLVSAGNGGGAADDEEDDDDLEEDSSLAGAD